MKNLIKDFLMFSLLLFSLAWILFIWLILPVLLWLCFKWYSLSIDLIFFFFGTRFFVWVQEFIEKKDKEEEKENIKVNLSKLKFTKEGHVVNVQSNICTTSKSTTNRVIKESNSTSKNK